MSQGFKLKYDKMLENNPSLSGSAYQDETLTNQFYEGESHSRNICFVKKDGYRIFLNYSHLVSGIYKPEAMEITLCFTSHNILLKGIFLELLYYRFMNHSVKQAICIDDRYNVISESNVPLINQLEIVEEKK